MYDSESIEGKTKIANEMLLTISRLSSEIERFEYIKKLSSALGVKEEILIAELKRINKSEFVRRAVSQDKIRTPIPITEKIILKFMLTQKEAYELIKRKLNENDFTHPLTKKAARGRKFMFNPDR